MLLQDLCAELVAELDAVGCIVSRVIGDVLVQVAEYAPDGRTFALGRGFLVSEFPETEAVLKTGLPKSVAVTDVAADPAEVRVLRELGLASVLMLALRPGEESWGLVEVYRGAAEIFDDEDVRRASAAVRRAAAELAAT